ncbi:MAG TPA: hypothetical protein VGF94_27225 [Kofleriaceae bacterium]
MTTSLLAAFMHPGHGTTDPDSWRHYLTEPVHVVTLAALAVVVVVAIAFLRAPRRQAKPSSRDPRL